MRLMLWMLLVGHVVHGGSLMLMMVLRGRAVGVGLGRCMALGGTRSVPQVIHLFLQSCNVLDRLLEDDGLGQLGSSAVGDCVAQLLKASVDVFSPSLFRQNVCVSPGRDARGGGQGADDRDAGGSRFQLLRLDGRGRSRFIVVLVVRHGRWRVV